MNPSQAKIIQENQFILLIDNRNDRKVVQVKKQKKLRWRKQNIPLEQFIGKEFNQVYEISKSQILSDEKYQKLFYNPSEILQQQNLGEQNDSGQEEDQKESDEEKDQEDDNNVPAVEKKQKSTSKDNRFMFQDQNTSNQKLTQEQIEQLKQKADINKSQLISTIVQNNVNFEKRTDFSKAKYMKRKNQKYYFLVQCQQTTADNLLTTYFLQNPRQINFLRMDSFSMLMHYSEIVSTSKVLLFEQSKGLILGTLLEKITNASDITLCAEQAKLNPNQLSIVQQLNIDDKTISQVQVQTPAQLLANKRSFTNVIVVGDFDTSQVLQNTYQMLQQGGIFVAFSNYLETLSECFEFMFKSKVFINIQVFDIFLREYQVLENRTHPKTSMSGFSGYILSGYKVAQ